MYFVVRPFSTIGLEISNSVVNEIDFQGAGLTSSVVDSLELAESTLSGWVSLAADCERLGLDSLWCSWDKYVRVTSSRAKCVDPSTILASMVPKTQSLMLGVFEDVSQGRHPTMFAREITTLDIVSSGRAGVAISLLDLRKMPKPHTMNSTFSTSKEMDVDSLVPTITLNEVNSMRQLIEYLQICRKMFSSGKASLDGVFYKVPNAVNLPPPVEPGEPFIACNLGLITSNVESFTQDGTFNIGDLVDVDHLNDLDRVLELADALIVSGSVGAIETLGSSLARRTPSWNSQSKLIWRGALATLDSRLVDRLVQAGVNGFICKVDQSSVHGFEKAQEAIGSVVIDITRALS